MISTRQMLFFGTFHNPPATFFAYSPYSGRILAVWSPNFASRFAAYLLFMPRLLLVLWLVLMALADVGPALAQGGPAARAKMRGKVYVHRPNYRTYKGRSNKIRRKRTVRYRQKWFQFWRRKKAKTTTPRRSRNQTIGNSQ